MHSEETLANLQKFLTLLNSSLKLDQMLTSVARQLVEMFEVDHSGMLLFGEDDPAGEVIAEYPSQGAVGLTVPLTDYPLVDRLKSERRPIAVLEAQQDPIMGSARSTMGALGIQSIVIIPLVVQEKIVGSLSLDVIDEQRIFTADELELCFIIGNQIAVAVDYTRSLEVAETNRRQAQTLQEINRVLSESLNLDEILPLILDQIQNIVPADGSSIYLSVEEGLQLVAARGTHGPFRNRSTVPLDKLWGAGKIIEDGRPILVSNTLEHEGWDIYEGSPVRSWLGLPLSVRGEVVGVLNIDGYSPGQFNETHMAQARAFADQAAIAIHNARLYGQAERRADLLASVQGISLSMVSSLEMQDVLRAIAASVLMLLDAAYVLVYLYDFEEGVFTLASGLTEGGEIEIEPISPRQDGLTATIVRTGEYLAISNTLEHPLYRDREDYEGFQAIIGIPLKKRDKVLGVLNVFYEQAHHFPPEEIALLNLLATQAAVALENARLYRAEQTRLEDEAKRAKKWQHVQKITASLNSSLDLEKILNTACEQFMRLIEVDHCGVVLFNTNGLVGRVVAEYPQTEAMGIHLSMDYPAAQRMLKDRNPFASFNVQDDPLLGEIRSYLTSVGIKSLLIAPLVIHDRVIGSIGLDAMKQPRHFTDEELNLCRIVANQMAIAIANARTYQAERHARLQADTLREIAAALNETLDLNTVLQRILAQLERVITYESSSIILREKELFRIVAARGFADLDSVIGKRFAFSDKPHVQEIAQTRRPLVIPNTDHYEWQTDGPATIRSWIGAPLVVSDQLIGLLAVDHSQADFYGQGDGELITAFADLAAIAIENAKLYEIEVKQIEQELSIARQIQKGFFPTQIPKIHGWEIAAICLPARETGGDFYEFVERNDGLLGLIVGDVAGKSISAAMLMSAAQSMVEAKGSDHRSPAKVMAETNRLLYNDVPKHAFVAMSYALMQPGHNIVCLSNGGQLDPFLVPADSRPIRLIEVPGNRLPLGVILDVNYQETSFTLAPGDMLVFYTDGIVERKDKTGGLFGFEGVASVLDGLRGQTPDIAISTLLQAADEFAGWLDPHDDVTLVVVQRQNN